MARSAQPQYQPPKSAEELERFKSEYPDLYDTVETVAHMRSEEQMNALQQKLSAIEMREAEMSKRDAELALRERHPDFEDIRGDDSFTNGLRLSLKKFSVGSTKTQIMLD